MTITTSGQDRSRTVSMTGGEEAAPRRGRAPLRQRSRRRWAIGGGVAAGWLVLEVMTGSAVSATLVLVAIAALAGASPGRPARPGHHQGSSLDTADGLAAVARRAGRTQDRHAAP